LNIKILTFEPGNVPYVTEIENELKPMNDIVGGYIEAVYLSSTAVLICNEEGKLNGLPMNRIVRGGMIVGTFFIAGYVDDEGEFTSISDADIEKYGVL